MKAYDFLLINLSFEWSVRKCIYDSPVCEIRTSQLSQNANFFSSSSQRTLNSLQSSNPLSSPSLFTLLFFHFLFSYYYFWVIFLRERKLEKIFKKASEEKSWKKSEKNPKKKKERRRFENNKKSRKWKNREA